MIVTWLDMALSHRKTMLDQAAAFHGLSPRAIEHDWWTTLTLRALFTTPYAPYCIFKGGSSLSKAWGLLRRFSEDIDIALMPEAFGLEYKLHPRKSYVTLLKGSGRAFVRTLVKKALINAFETLGASAPCVKVSFEESWRGDPAIILVRYRSILKAGSHPDQVVKIEFTMRNLKNPFREVLLRSILSEAFVDNIYKEEPFLALVAAPHKTLIEKLFLVHEKFSSLRPAAIRDAGRSLHWQSRHLYDIVELMNTDVGAEALRDTTLYHTLAQHRRYYSRLKNVDYQTLVHARLNFVPSVEWQHILRPDYESLRRSLIYGGSPSFEQLLSQLELYNRSVRLIGSGVPPDRVISDFMSAWGHQTDPS